MEGPYIVFVKGWFTFSQPYIPYSKCQSVSCLTLHISYRVSQTQVTVTGTNFPLVPTFECFWLKKQVAHCTYLGYVSAYKLIFTIELIQVTTDMLLEPATSMTINHKGPFLSDDISYNEIWWSPGLCDEVFTVISNLTDSSVNSSIATSRRDLIIT